METAQRDMAALDAAVAAQERRQQQIAQRQADRAQRKQDAAEGGATAAARPLPGGLDLGGQAQQSSEYEDSMLGSGSESDEGAEAQARKRRLLLSTTGGPGGDGDSGSDEAAMDSLSQQPPASGGSGGGGKKAKPPALLKKPKNRYLSLISAVCPSWHLPWWQALLVARRQTHPTPSLTA